MIELPTIEVRVAYTAKLERIAPPEKVTANGVKKLMGEPLDSWMMVRMNPHQYVKPAKGIPACKCFFCQEDKKGTFEPLWSGNKPGASFWHYIRLDVQNKNVRFEPQDGEMYHIVREVDVDYWLEELTTRFGRWGITMAWPLAYDRALRRNKIVEVEDDDQSGLDS